MRNEAGHSGHSGATTLSVSSTPVRSNGMDRRFLSFLIISWVIAAKIALVAFNSSAPTATPKIRKRAAARIKAGFGTASRLVTLDWNVMVRVALSGPVVQSPSATPPLKATLRADCIRCGNLLPTAGTIELCETCNSRHGGVD